VILTHFNYVSTLVLSALRMATGVGQHVDDYCVMILLSYFQEHLLVFVKKLYSWLRYRKNATESI